MVGFFFVRRFVGATQRQRLGQTLNAANAKVIAKAGGCAPVGHIPITK